MKIKIKIKILLLLSLIIFVACNDDNYEKDSVLESQGFRVLDREKRDLLNPELKLENSIDFNKIKLYFLIKGQKIEVRDYWKNSRPDVILDNPDGLGISAIDKDGEKKYILGVSLNYEPTDNDIAYTFIEWNQHEWDMDTIQSKVSRRESVFESIMVMFNDSVWNRPNNPVPPNEWTLLDQSFTIIK